MAIYFHPSPPLIFLKLERFRTAINTKSAFAGPEGPPHLSRQSPEVLLDSRLAIPREKTFTRLHGPDLERDLWKEKTSS